MVSNATPIEKTSEHLFFKLQDMEQLLRQWLTSEHIPTQLGNKLQEWFDAGLKSWDISRDAPYFGFEISDGRSNLKFPVNKLDIVHTALLI